MISPFGYFVPSNPCYSFSALCFFAKFPTVAIFATIELFGISG
jgi:hypothetical protein